MKRYEFMYRRECSDGKQYPYRRKTIRGNDDVSAINRMINHINKKSLGRADNFCVDYEMSRCDVPSESSTHDEKFLDLRTFRATLDNEGIRVSC